MAVNGTNVMGVPPLCRGGSNSLTFPGVGLPGAGSCAAKALASFDRGMGRKLRTRNTGRVRECEWGGPRPVVSSALELR